jgi:hypothetical protein
MNPEASKIKTRHERGENSDSLDGRRFGSEDAFGLHGICAAVSK